MRSKSLVILVTALLLLASVGPVVAADSTGLAVSVDQQADGVPIVTVTNNGTAVENASVMVTAPGGTANYTTDANGTVSLPAPTDNVTIEVTATAGNATATTTANLTVAPAETATTDLAVAVSQDGSGAATVTVTDNGTAVDNATVNVSAVNGTYVGEGSYTTDANGTVALPAPLENVTIAVTATAGNATASTTADLTVGENQAFGSRVSAFVHRLLQVLGTDSPMGRAVAGWVVAHNPGHAPAHAGPKAGDDHGRPSFAKDHGRAGANGHDGAHNGTAAVSVDYRHAGWGHDGNESEANETAADGNGQSGQGHGHGHDVGVERSGHGGRSDGSHGHDE